MPHIVVQEWEESEREPGWGVTVRPDGYSLHANFEGCSRFRAEFRERQRARLGEEVPSSYRREAGEPFTIKVSERIMQEVRAALRDKDGVWGNGECFPGARSITVQGVGAGGAP